MGDGDVSYQAVVWAMATFAMGHYKNRFLETGLVRSAVPRTQRRTPFRPSSSDKKKHMYQPCQGSSSIQDLSFFEASLEASSTDNDIKSINPCQWLNH